jgi:hypothetical protein
VPRSFVGQQRTFVGQQRRFVGQQRFVVHGRRFVHGHGKRVCWAACRGGLLVGHGDRVVPSAMLKTQDYIQETEIASQDVLQSHHRRTAVLRW